MTGYDLLIRNGWVILPVEVKKKDYNNYEMFLDR
jgi:hypothetical protein